MKIIVLKYACAECGEVLIDTDDYCSYCGEIPVVEQTLRLDFS